METIKRFANTPGNVYDEKCPTRKVLDRIADKWTMLVVGLLLDFETIRFSDLQRMIGGISQKMLTQTLRTLERDGLVTRKVYAEVPPRVEYSLTPLGQTLRVPIQAIQEWAEMFIAEVGEAQAIYDAAHAEKATQG